MSRLFSLVPGTRRLTTCECVVFVGLGIHPSVHKKIVTEASCSEMIQCGDAVTPSVLPKGTIGLIFCGWFVATKQIDAK